MSFSKENGYIPYTFEQLMSSVREEINSQFGTNFNEENFVGTGWYKFSYGPIQKVLEGEIKTSEIFLKLQEYIRIENLRIQRPSVSFDGIIDTFSSKGYIVSVKPPSEEDAGKSFICIDIDGSAPDYALKKIEICTIIKDFGIAGIPTFGTESELITISNGQSFDFKYNLPDRHEVMLKANFVKSKNHIYHIPTDEELRQLVFDNIKARYRLGWDFEPERYISVSDALWASDVTLEYSLDEGETWEDTVYTAEYDDKFEIELDDIQVVIT